MFKAAPQTTANSIIGAQLRLCVHAKMRNPVDTGNPID
jgi:hypothetical protein